MGALTIQFCSSISLYTTSIYAPNFSYKTEISLPFEYVELGNGELGIYDNGSEYDVRRCMCQFELSESDHSNFVSFINSSNATRQDGKTIMTLQTDSGFYPFGPDKGPAGTYSIALINPTFQGIGVQPYKYYRTNVTIVNTGAYPSYSLPTDEADCGSWTIGTVSDVVFPDMWFKPKIDLNYHGDTQNDGEVNMIDRGSSGDTHNTSFNLKSNEPKAARIIDYITSTSRGDSFAISVPNDYYPFGYEQGDNKSFDVWLSQNKITITHVMFNRFDFNLSFRLV